jgi:phosphohistidine phosphatase
MKTTMVQRRIWLVRHAKAESGSAGQRDLDRALTPRGRLQCRQLGRWLGQRIGADSPIIRVSPARRTRETARLALAELALDADMISIDERIWEAAARDLLALIGESTGELVLIGHNPGLEQVQFALTGQLLPLPPGGAFEVEWSAAKARLAASFQPSSEAI